MTSDSQDHSGADAAEQAEIRRLVRAAAGRLVDELERARVETDEWRDSERGRELVGVALDRCLATLAALGLVGRDNQPPSHELWQIAGAWLERGDLQHRARSKPRGYAGDYELLADCWDRNATASSPGRLFDRYFLEQAAVEAVRARTEWAAAEIAQGCAQSAHAEFRVVSVGSGPGIDLYEAALRLPIERRARLRFTLVDMEEAALDSARSRLQSVVGSERIATRRENLFRLATNRKAGEFLRDVDFLLCTGFMDYLADDVATAQLNLFWNALRPDGMLMVGNFAPANPTRAYMEWIGNWYLTYRTAGDLARLAESAGIPSSRRRIAADRTGCDLFVLARRAGDGDDPSPHAA